MHTSRSGRHLQRTAALAVVLAFGVSAPASDVPTTIDFNDFSAKESWVSFSGGLVDLDDDSAPGSYQRQRQHEDAGFGGVDAFRLKRLLDNDRILTIDGKALFGDNEYKLVFRLADEANGWSFEGGFKESRVFYNGVGGYFPGNGAWFRVYDDELFIDRGEFWLAGTMTKNQWTLRLRGAHQYRDGAKDSTAWGDTNRTGLTGSTANRNIVSSWLGIDETRDSFTIDLDYDTETAQGGVGVRWENLEQENSRNILRQPGNPNPTGAGQRYLVTREGSESDLFASHAFVQKNYGDKWILSAAGSFTNLDTTLSGNRVFGASYDADYDIAFPRGSTDHGYIDMDGDTQWDQWVLASNAVYLPAKGWRLQGGVRFENQTQDSISHYIETGGPIANPLVEPFEQDSAREFDEFLASIEGSYSGIKNWVFSAAAEAASGDGDLLEAQREGHDLPLTVVIDRLTDFERDYRKLSATARWYPSTKANFAFGAYRKNRDNDYTTIADNTPPTGGNRYPAFINQQEFTTDDVYVRGTFRPARNFSLTVRYDQQQTEITSREDNLTATVRSELEAAIVSATASWTPHPRLMVQAGMNLVDDEVITGTVTANSPVAPSIGRFDNDYTSCSGLVMFVVDDKTDVQVDFYRFDSDNLENIATLTQPYGLTATDETVGVTYTRRINEDLRFSVRYVFVRYDELTAGGNNDFDSQMLYGRVQLRF